MAVVGTLKCLNCANPLKLLTNEDGGDTKENPLNPPKNTMWLINNPENNNQFYCCIPCHSFYVTCNKCYFHTLSNKWQMHLETHDELPTVAEYRTRLKQALSVWIAVGPIIDFIIDYKTNGFCQLMSFPYAARNISATPLEILALWKKHVILERGYGGRPLPAIYDEETGMQIHPKGSVDVSSLHWYRFDTTYCQATGYDGMSTHSWRCNDCGNDFSCGGKW
jgi:hypothetical protein